MLQTRADYNIIGHVMRKNRSSDSGWFSWLKMSAFFTKYSITALPSFLFSSKSQPGFLITIPCLLFGALSSPPALYRTATAVTRCRPVFYGRERTPELQACRDIYLRHARRMMLL